MRTSLLAVAVVAVIAGLVLWSSSARREAVVPRNAEAVSATAPGIPSGARARADRTSASASVAPAPVAAANAAAGRGAGLRARLVDGSGAGVAGLAVRLVGAHPGTRAISDATGWVELDGVAPSPDLEIAVELVHTRHGPLPVPSEHVATLDAPPPAPFMLPEFGFVDVLAVTHAKGVELDGCTLAAFAAYGLQDLELDDGACRVRLPLTGRWRVPVTLPVAGDASTGVVHLHVDVPGALRSEHVAVDRPIRTGDARTVRVVLGESRVVLTGRVWGEAAPLAGGDVLVVVAPHEVGGAAPGAALALDRLRSARSLDDEGRFRLDLVDGWVGVPSDVCIETGDARAAFASVTPIGAVEHDLGDLVLEPAPLLVAGRVLDEHGAPLEGVRLSDREHDPWDPPWHGFPERWALSAADGTFELRGARVGSARGVRFQLFAEAEGRVPSRATGVAPGTRDVQVVMLATGAVEGRVVVAGEPLSVEGARVLLRAAPPDPTLRHPPWYAAELDAQGRFRIDGVPAGEYEASLVAGRLEDATPRLAPLVVRAGEVARDPRLDPWDVAANVRVQLVRLATESGPVTCKVNVAWRPSGSDEHWRETGFVAASHRSLLVPTGAVDLSIHSFEHRLRRLAGIEGPVDVLLRAAPRLVLRTTPVDLPDGVRLRPGLLAVDGSPVDGFLTELDWQPDGSYLGFATRPGTFRVRWRAQHRGRSVQVPESAPFLLELDPEGASRDVVVPIHGESLRAALSDLERDP